jgi:pyrroloquinoline-quinone synthase
VIESFWREVEAILDAKSLLKHPFYQAWTMGALTRYDLAYYAQQYFQQEARFPRYVSAVHSNCPEIKTRQMLLENLTHEESGPENHSELWLAFAGAVGASRESVQNAEMNAGTKKCVDSFTKLSRGSWQTGLAALYAYEVQQPAVAKTKIAGLKAQYGLSSKAALGFFEVHETVDVWHAESSKEILTAEVRKNPGLGAEVKASISEACDSLNALLDGVCKSRGIACHAN